MTNKDCKSSLLNEKYWVNWDPNPKSEGPHCNKRMPKTIFLIFYFVSAEPQLMLTAGPGMIGPGFSPAYSNSYATGMPYQGYGM